MLCDTFVPVHYQALFHCHVAILVLTLALTSCFQIIVLPAWLLTLILVHILAYLNKSCSSDNCVWLSVCSENYKQYW